MKHKTRVFLLINVPTTEANIHKIWQTDRQRDRQGNREVIYALVYLCWWQYNNSSRQCVIQIRLSWLHLPWMSSMFLTFGPIQAVNITTKNNHVISNEVINDPTGVRPVLDLHCSGHPSCLVRTSVLPGTLLWHHGAWKQKQCTSYLTCWWQQTAQCQIILKHSTPPIHCAILSCIFHSGL